MSLRQKIIFNTGVQFFGRFLTSLVGFFTTLILARFLGAKDYGVYAKIYTLAAFFYLFVDFGLNAVYLRKYKGNLNHLAQVFRLRSLFFLFSLLLILCFFLFSGSLIFSFQEQLWTVLFAPTILLFGYYTSLNIVFQLKLRYDLSVLASVIGGLVGLLSLLMVIRYGLVYAILSVVFGYFLTVMIAFLFTKRLAKVDLNLLKPASSSALKSLFVEALPLGVMLFLNTMYSRVDVFVISAFQNDSAVGVYQLAYKFFEFPLAFAAFFANAVFPHYLKTFATDRPRFWQIFQKATLSLVMVSLLFSVGGFLLAPYLSLVKSDYAASALPLQILSLSYPIFFLTSALSWLFFMQKKERQLIWVYGGSFLLNIFANLLLVPHYGYLASSWLTVLGELLVLLMLVLLLQKKK